MSESTLRSDEWALGHLLPHFAEWPLDAINAEIVDAYRNAKVSESEARRRAIERRAPFRNERGQALRPLAPSTINKTIDVLQWIPSVALDYKHVTRECGGRQAAPAAHRAAPPRSSGLRGADRGAARRGRRARP